MREIVAWEGFGRYELPQPLAEVFAQAMNDEGPDLAICQRASERMHEVTNRIEDRLRDAEWIVAGAKTAADVTAVPAVFYSMVPPAVAAKNPIAAFFAEHFHLGEGRERTRAWVGRVMAYDR